MLNHHDQMLLAFASGGLLPKSHDKRAVPDRKNPVSTKVDNSTPPSDPVEFWKQHNHGLCDLGMVSQRNNTVCCLPTSCKPGNANVLQVVIEIGCLVIKFNIAF